MTLKAYIVHDGNEGENAALVFAESPAEARKIGFGFNELGDGVFFSMRAHRYQAADRLVVVQDHPTPPYIETRPEILGGLGWNWSEQ